MRQQLLEPFLTLPSFGGWYSSGVPLPCTEPSWGAAGLADAQGQAAAVGSQGGKPRLLPEAAWAQLGDDTMSPVTWACSTLHHRSGEAQNKRQG